MSRQLAHDLGQRSVVTGQLEFDLSDSRPLTGKPIKLDAEAHRCIVTSALPKPPLNVHCRGKDHQREQANDAGDRQADLQPLIDWLAADALSREEQHVAAVE